MHQNNNIIIQTLATRMNQNQQHHPPAVLFFITYTRSAVLPITHIRNGAGALPLGAPLRCVLRELQYKPLPSHFVLP